MSLPSLADELVTEYIKAKDDVVLKLRRASELTVRERAGMLIHVFGGAKKAVRAIEGMSTDQDSNNWVPVQILLVRALAQEEKAEKK